MGSVWETLLALVFLYLYTFRTHLQSWLCTCRHVFRPQTGTKSRRYNVAPRNLVHADAVEGDEVEVPRTNLCIYMLHFAFIVSSLFHPFSTKATR
jgi:hypothetical protein